MWQHFNANLDYIVHRMTWCGWNIPLRRIPNFELVFFLKGECHICMDSKPFIARAGDLVCFRPGVLHSLTVPGEPCAEFYGFHFTLPGREDLPLPDVCRLHSSQRLESLLHSMLDAFHQKGYLDQWQRNLLLEQCLCEIFCTLHRENTSSEFRRIRKVLGLIHADPYRPFTLEELLECSGIRKTCFIQDFRRVTGMSPMQYISTLRLEHARMLLLEGNDSVASISELCGFADSFYFSRAFKKQFGASPANYRREHGIL